MTGISIKQALRMAQHALMGSDTGQIDAELMLAAALGKARTYLYTWPEQILTPAQRSYFESVLERRVLGEPVAYIIGTRDFWTLTLRVNRSVLIPRPETELLVETALALVTTPEAHIADLGTGSGAIALALASERRLWKVVATDMNIAALTVASDNASLLGIPNVKFRQGSWCEALEPAQFDLIVSNPPYIDAADPHLAQGDLRFEPRPALVAADEGLADIRTLCSQASNHLKTGGWLLLEHGWTQGSSVRGSLEQNGFDAVSTLKDLNGKDRVTLGRRGLSPPALP
jgi:release factor glutamine methyltransferase